MFGKYIKKIYVYCLTFICNLAKHYNVRGGSGDGGVKQPKLEIMRTNNNILSEHYIRSTCLSNRSHWTSFLHVLKQINIIITQLQRRLQETTFRQELKLDTLILTFFKDEGLCQSSIFYHQGVWRDGWNLLTRSQVRGLQMQNFLVVRVLPPIMGLPSANLNYSRKWTSDTI